MLALAMTELCGISISPKTSQCSDSSQGPTEAKHCVDLRISPINDRVAEEKCQRTVVTLLLDFPGYSSYRDTQSSRLFVEKECR